MRRRLSDVEPAGLSPVEPHEQVVQAGRIDLPSNVGILSFRLNDNSHGLFTAEVGFDNLPHVVVDAEKSIGREI